VVVAVFCGFWDVVALLPLLSGTTLLLATDDEEDDVGVGRGGGSLSEGYAGTLIDEMVRSPISAPSFDEEDDVDGIVDDTGISALVVVD